MDSMCPDVIWKISKTTALKLLQNIVVSYVNEDNHSVILIIPDDANIHVDAAFV